MELKCKKCNSENLKVVRSGPHYKLVCGEKDCLTYQRFIKKSEAKTLQQLMQDDTISLNKIK